MQTKNSPTLALAILLALNVAATSSLSLSSRGISEAGEIALNVHRRLLYHEPPMEASKTLEILKRVEGFLRNEDDSAARIVTNQVRELIELGEVNELNCSRNRFNYAQVKDKHRNQTNILAYLEHNKQAQYDFCKELLLNRDLAKLTDQEQRELASLMNSVRGEKDLQHSIASYVSDTLINPRRVVQLAESEVSNLFEKLIGNVCRSVETNTSNVSDFFFTSMLDLSLIKERLTGDKELRAALRSVAICRLINREREHLVKMIQNLVESKTRARLEYERATGDDDE